MQKINKHRTRPKRLAAALLAGLALTLLSATLTTLPAQADPPGSPYDGDSHRDSGDTSDNNDTGRSESGRNGHDSRDSDSEPSFWDSWFGESEDSEDSDSEPSFWETQTPNHRFGTAGSAEQDTKVETAASLK